MPHGIKIATFRDDGEVEEAITSTTLRTRDTVFPLFGDAGTKSATEAELQEFGESVRARPDEAEGLLFVAPEEGEENLPARRCKLTEVENNPILRYCEDEPRTPMPTQLEHVPRRWAAGGPPARSHGAESREKGRRVQRRDARNHERAATMTPTVKNRQRDVSESLAQQ